MDKDPNERKFHGKKRSYFFKQKASSNGQKEADRLQITSSKRERNGSKRRKTINFFIKDLPAVLGKLQEFLTLNNNKDDNNDDGSEDNDASLPIL